jgi:hypothetical protein
MRQTPHKRSLFRDHPPHQLPKFAGTKCQAADARRLLSASHCRICYNLAKDLASSYRLTFGGLHAVGLLCASNLSYCQYGNDERRGSK